MRGGGVIVRGLAGAVLTYERMLLGVGFGFGSGCGLAFRCGCRLDVD